MYNPVEDDNELDRLSREAAAGYKAPGRPDWDSMQEKLDKVLPEEKKKRRSFLLWWLVPALLLGGFAYYQLKETPLTADLDTNNGKVSPTLKSAAPSTPDVVTKVPVAEENNIDPPIPAARSMVIAKQHIFSPSPSLTAPVSSNTDITVNTTKAAEQPVAVATVNPVETKETPSPAVIVDKEKEPVIETPATESPIITTTKKSKTGKAWSIGVLGSIDESTVKFKYGYEPGYGIGVLAGFHFNKIFSIHSGAIYTQKNYKMAGSDFNAPKGSWPSYYKLDEVEGYCRMWEVPLLARFYTSHSDKKGIFLSTGISSYFMTHENYTYGYQYLGQPASRTLDYTKSTTHILSIFHLSAGFESTVGKNLYLQIEPYAKIPMGGVGTGSIQLSSFGVNVGVQLRKKLKN